MGYKQKTITNTLDINPSISKVALNIDSQNGLREKLSEWTKNRTQLYVVSKTPFYKGTYKLKVNGKNILY